VTMSELYGAPLDVFQRRERVLGETGSLRLVRASLESDGRGLTMFVASDPNNLSSFFHATQDCIFRFESLFRNTSKGTPGFMSEALIQSDS
jgi:hypothetical protein